MNDTLVYRFYHDADHLHGDVELSARVGMLDFWRWAFSDLLEDTLKGLYSEWMVGQLLGLPMPHGGRPGYGNFDLLSPGGLRIEVKSSAYWQSWKLRNEDGSLKTAPEIERWRPPPGKPITFGGLRARDAVDRSNQTAGYKSDLYVFCFQSESDPERWDALDLDQWEFYALARSALEEIGVASLSLKRLRNVCAPMSAREFQVRGRELIARLDAALGTPPMA
jgi:hypothetical protein